MGKKSFAVGNAALVWEGKHLANTDSCGKRREAPALLGKGLTCQGLAISVAQVGRDSSTAAIGWAAAHQVGAAPVKQRDLAPEITHKKL